MLSTAKVHSLSMFSALEVSLHEFNRASFFYLHNEYAVSFRLLIIFSPYFVVTMELEEICQILSNFLNKYLWCIQCPYLLLSPLLQ